jgi:hypothetical protein
MTSAAGASDLELLQIEIEIWATDDRQRVNGPDLVIASSAVGSAAAIGTAVPDDLAAALVKVVTSEPPLSDLSSPPTMLEHCQQLLEDKLGPVELRPSSGPSYLIPETVTFRSEVTLVRSDGSNSGEPGILSPRQIIPGDCHVSSCSPGWGTISTRNSGFVSSNVLWTPVTRSMCRSW